MAPTPSIWVLSDGRAGHERQSLALARALSRNEPCVWRLQARAPWRWFAPRKLPGAVRAFGAEFAEALRHPPELAIGCGRQMALATRLARQAGAKAVQILDPRIDPRHWDAVIVPEHDALRGANVLTTIGSLHEVDAGSLAAARARFPQFGTLASPRTLLLLGGPIADVPLDAAWWGHTRKLLRIQHEEVGGSLSICASPRTPAWLAGAARADLMQIPGARWFGADDGVNPYAGLLAWAERIVVSPDSINMISEACATNAPVWVAWFVRMRGRHDRFVSTLFKQGRVMLLDCEEVESDRAPLIELTRVADALRSLLAL